jgi:hypothetical protein
MRVLKVLVAAASFAAYFAGLILLSALSTRVVLTALSARPVPGLFIAEH